MLIGLRGYSTWGKTTGVAEVCRIFEQGSSLLQLKGRTKGLLKGAGLHVSSVHALCVAIVLSSLELKAVPGYTLIGLVVVAARKQCCAWRAVVHGHGWEQLCCRM